VQTIAMRALDDLRRRPTDLPDPQLTLDASVEPALAAAAR